MDTAILITLITFLMVLGVIAIPVVAIISAKVSDKKNADAKKAEKERWERLSPDEQKKEIARREEQSRRSTLEYLSKARYNYSPPFRCPSCHSENYTLEGEHTHPRHVSKWILDSTDTFNEEKFDHATQVYGSATIYTKTIQKTVNTYRCPHCGYKYKKQS